MYKLSLNAACHTPQLHCVGAMLLSVESASRLADENLIFLKFNLLACDIIQNYGLAQ